MSGNSFRDFLVKEIKSWDENIEILTEKPVGMRFVGTPRKLDIILKKDNRYMGIEAKLQKTNGTAYQKLIYALEDCKTAPIPTIIVFTGEGIKDDIKSQLISSGMAIEVKVNEEDETLIDRHNIFRQRVAIELGLDWFKLYN